jgi:hypothetical protein
LTNEKNLIKTKIKYWNDLGKTKFDLQNIHIAIWPKAKRIRHNVIKIKPKTVISSESLRKGGDVIRV